MLYVIATIKDDNRYVGFRLLDTDTNFAYLIHYDIMCEGLARGTVIENVKLVGGKVCAKTGSLDDYTTINERLDVYGHESLVVLGTTPDNKILYSDYRGTLATASNENLLNYYNVMYSKNSKCSGLANCKIRNNRIITC